MSTRHLPASHPVLRRALEVKSHEQMRDNEEVTAGLAAVALIVAKMPDLPLSINERLFAQVIVNELLRRIAR